MQRGRGGRDDFFGGFGDPFAGFPGFGGRPGSLMSNFFGGRDPFDDPFFTQPFGSMMGPSMFGPNTFGSGFGATSNGFLEQQRVGNMLRPSMFGPSTFGPGFGETSNGFLEQQRIGNMMGPSMFGPSIFGPGFGETSNGFLEQQAPSQPAKSKGPIIKEISSDGEEEDDNDGGDNKDNPRKHSRSTEGPYVQDPDEEVEEKKSRTMQNISVSDRGSFMHPQSQNFSFQSSTVTYGGPNGAYYTASTTRRKGGDGVVMEESKEADTTTGKATHRVSRGIHDKGHTVTRKLSSDGRVDNLQTLHNLNEDELTGFDEAWRGKARQHLPGWNQGHEMLDDSNTGVRGNSRSRGQAERGWALPSTVQLSAPSSIGGRFKGQSGSNSSTGGTN